MRIQTALIEKFVAKISHMGDRGDKKLAQVQASLLWLPLLTYSLAVWIGEIIKTPHPPHSTA